MNGIAPGDRGCPRKHCDCPPGPRLRSAKWCFFRLVPRLVPSPLYVSTASDRHRSRRRREIIEPASIEEIRYGDRDATSNQARRAGSKLPMQHHQVMEPIMKRDMFRSFFRTKTAIRAVLIAMSLATIVPVADAAISGTGLGSVHQGPYDNTGQGPQQSGLEGGG
jgi:hypothetical protein